MTAKSNRDKFVDSKLGSVHLPADLLARGPEAIADSLASQESSPQGLASGMRVLSFYLNYTGRVLSASRRRKLEKAKRLLSARVDRALKSKEGSLGAGIR